MTTRSHDDHLGGTPGHIETTVHTDLAARAARSRHLAGALPVLGWLPGVGHTPNSGRAVSVQVAVVDLSERPDVADLARVWAAEEAANRSWTGHVVTGWTAMLDRHGETISAPLVCDVAVTRPVSCRFRLVLDYLAHKGVVREMERTGYVGLIDRNRVARDAWRSLGQTLGEHAFVWRFKAATLAKGMAEIDDLLRETAR